MEARSRCRGRPPGGPRADIDRHRLRSGFATGAGTPVARSHTEASLEGTREVRDVIEAVRQRDIRDGPVMLRGIAQHRAREVQAPLPDVRRHGLAERTDKQLIESPTTDMQAAGQIEGTE